MLRAGAVVDYLILTKWRAVPCPCPSSESPRKNHCTPVPNEDKNYLRPKFRDPKTTCRKKTTRQTEGELGGRLYIGPLSLPSPSILGF